MAERGVHVAIKRAYAEPASTDGTRVLVDRLWPRGLSKERAHIDLWLKDVAPSAELRKWYGHDPAKFDAFRERYIHELEAEKGARRWNSCASSRARDPSRWSSRRGMSSTARRLSCRICSPIQRQCLAENSIASDLAAA
jgi:uncharacterized protein YeaO (DUF488 family)